MCIRDRLYDELKEYAARNHRSIAQQTIIAVEEMLAEASALRQEPFPFDADRLSRLAPRNGDIPVSYTHLDVYKRQSEDLSRGRRAE